jgi:protein TonB
MFRETLLESAPFNQKRQHWPLATAFILELLAGSALVVLPLLSRGVLPLSSMHAPVPLQLGLPNLPQGSTTGHHDSVGPSRPASTAVLSLVSIGHRAIGLNPSGQDVSAPPDLCICGDSRLPNNMVWAVAREVAPEPPKRIRVSVLSEAALVNKVEPVYPRIAIISGTQGEVRLHAIIAKDGSIQSLNVISGHPTLAAAALAAVRQWRYQPYKLNGEPVEVETFITVNFKRTL